MNLPPLAALFDPVSAFSLERMLTDPRAFGLTTASPFQRALCRVLDGLPLGDLANDTGVIQAFGGPAAVAALPTVPPRELVLLAGIRSGKSLIASACGVRAALSCDLNGLGPGELPTLSILSVSLREAKKTWAHVRGRIEASPELRALLIGEPKADSLQIRHPSGRPVRIAVVAGARAAASLVGDWSVGVIFDEAPRMVGEADGVVNLDHARRAVAGRLRPGAQVIMSGSPWAPFGPVYELVQEAFARPTMNLVVARATGPVMNPLEWTPAKCAELKERSPDAYAVDVECKFMAPGATLLNATELEACATLAGPLLPDPLMSYVAVIDPATRGNAWALLLLTNPGGSRAEIALAREWVGSSSKPLSPRAVLQEIAGILAPYRVTAVDSDQWSADALRDLAISVGLYLRTHAVTGPERVEQFERVRAYVTDRRLTMPRDPVLLRDLGSIIKRVTSTGVAIDLPATADGRHCDFAAALALGLAQVLPEPDVAPPEPTEKDYTRERKAALSAQIQRQNKRRGWQMPP